MQIGLRIGPQNVFTPVPAYLAFVRRAEELGFDPPLFSDTASLSHFHVRDPFVVMALAAGVTERAGLGTGATTPFTRPPRSWPTRSARSTTRSHRAAPTWASAPAITAAYLIGKRAARLAEIRVDRQ